MPHRTSRHPFLILFSSIFQDTQSLPALLLTFFPLNYSPFGAWSSSSSDDEFIPNDIYFGTPDRVFTATTKIRCQRQKMLNDRYSKQSKTNRSNKRKYGEEPDADQRRKQKQKLEEISRLNLPTYQQQQLQTLLRKKKKNRPDRFYDKSQDIPNDIYFGNVNGMEKMKWVSSVPNRNKLSFQFLSIFCMVLGIVHRMKSGGVEISGGRRNQVLAALAGVRSINQVAKLIRKLRHLPVISK